METVEEETGTIPGRVVTLDRIAGMEAAKRALEVALAGEHGIAFIFNSNSQAAELVRTGHRIAEKHGLVFHGLAYPACKCGNYGSRTTECRCRPGSLKIHLARLARRKAEFDIWMDACCLRPASIQFSPGETEGVIADRILAARKTEETTGDLDSASRELLTAYQKHAGTVIDQECILRVAHTIARLDGSERTIQPHHVAEAIQYQAASISWLWACLNPQSMELKTQNGNERR